MILLCHIMERDNEGLYTELFMLSSLPCLLSLLVVTFYNVLLLLYMLCNTYLQVFGHYRILVHKENVVTVKGGIMHSPLARALSA